MPVYHLFLNEQPGALEMSPPYFCYFATSYIKTPSLTTWSLQGKMSKGRMEMLIVWNTFLLFPSVPIVVLHLGKF